MAKPGENVPRGLLAVQQKDQLLTYKCELSGKDTQMLKNIIDTCVYLPDRVNRVDIVVHMD